MSGIFQLEHTNGTSKGERRIAPRHRRNLRAWWRPLGTPESDFTPGRLLDISPNGIALFVDPPLHRGQIVVIRLDAGGGVGPWVMRVTRALEQPNGGWLVGCSFARKLSDDAFRGLLDAISPTALLAIARKAAAGSQAASSAQLNPTNKERRTAPRRKGAAVTVELAHLRSRSPHVKGWVRDRSLGGLGICAPSPVAVGSNLKVRVTTGSDHLPWVAVRVISCRAVGKEWLVGCQFVEAPPVAVMLFFG